MQMSLLTQFYKFVFVAVVLFGVKTYGSDQVYTSENTFSYKPTLDFNSVSNIYSNTQKLEVIKKLGEGAEAIVFLVKNTSHEHFALRLPRLIVGTSFNELYSKYDLNFKKQKINETLFLPINELIVLESAGRELKVPALIMPYAEGQFSQFNDSEIERFSKVGPMLASILTEVFSLHNQGYKLNDLSLRNIVQYRGEHKLIDYDRTELNTKYSGPGINSIGPEYFSEKVIHPTSDFFQLALSIANYFYNKTYDFRFHHHGHSPIEKDLEKGGAEFTEFYEKFYYKKSFEPESFYKNKEIVLEYIKNRAQELRGQLPDSSLKNINLVTGFLNSTLIVDPNERLNSLKLMTKKFDIDAGPFFCRSLF